jgi:Terminase large subunit, T4likevirus-type, N-terminal
MSKVIDLGFRARPWQEAAYRGMKRFSVLVVHRRGGKTMAAVLKLIDAALRAKLPDSRYAYVAPQRNQAKTIAWDYLKRFATKIPGTEVSEQELFVQFPNGARVRLFGADNPDSLRGQYFDGLVLDEVAQMKSEVWGEILLPALSDRKGWAFFIGTPKGLNLFSELYFKAKNDPEWYAASYTCYQTDALVPEEIERAKKEMSEAQFRQEMLCDFSASSENRFISIDLVEAARKREVGASLYDPLIIGVDVGRFGDDPSVICIRKGRDARTHGMLSFRGLDTMQVAARVAEQYEFYRADGVFVDEGGVGGGVVDRLRQLRVPIIGIQFGGKPDRSQPGQEFIRYANKRAEMYGNVREWLKVGGIPDNDQLMQELTGMEYSYVLRDGVDAILLESKESMKERGLGSPDMADALALTFAYPVQPNAYAGRAAANRTPMVQTDYDPYNEPAQSNVRRDYDPFNA